MSTTNTPRTEAELYLGIAKQHGERVHVFASLAYEAEEGRATTMRHEAIQRRERLSVSFSIIRAHWKVSERRRHAADFPDGYWTGGGQTPADDRRIVSAPAPYAVDAETRKFIEHVWREWHLNDMHAECAHMTPEMLTPTPEQLAEYIAANPERGRYGEQGALQSWRLDNVTCPETGYRYGHAWLYAQPPADIIARARQIIADTTEEA